MRIARTFGWLSVVAGITAWYATRAAMRRHEDRQRLRTEEMTRWEGEGGATTAGPQPPSAAT